MKQIILTICIAAVLFTACNNSKKTDEAKTDMTTDTTVKMTDQKTESYVMPDSATMIKNWQAYMTPGDVHKMIASWDGTWEGNVTMQMSPGTPEQKSTSTAVNKMIMGGRYQISNHSGSMMGMPFEGMSTLAYDNGKKVFISTWIDNMGTGMMSLQGPWDEATKTISLKGKVVEPGSGTGMEVDVRETFRIIDQDHQVVEMFGMGPDGKEFKSMHIDFSRKK